MLQMTRAQQLSLIAAVFLLFGGLEAQAIMNVDHIEQTLSGLGLIGTVILFFLRSREPVD